MVWLGLLPYTIRQVWRFLFWLSEGGWPPSDLTTVPNGSSNETLESQVVRQVEFTALINNGVAQDTLIGANITKYMYMRTVVDRLTQFLLPVSHGLRVSGSDDIATSLFKSIYNRLGISSSTNTERPLIKSSMYIRSKGSSLLSDVSFFKNLTKNASFNQLLINITEGYIITILVVVCFVLVFLIREWVVQQQPGINIGIGFNAEPAPNERPRDEQQDPGTLADTQGEFNHMNEDGEIPVEHAIQRNLDLQFPNRGDTDERSHEFLESNDGEVEHDPETEIHPALAANHDILNFENNAEVVPRAARVNNADAIDLNDPEVIEDAEDFEGIMELLGMRGPIFSLVQNALFSALLLGLTITVGVWFPYNIGRVSLLLLANPGTTLKVPLKIVFGCAAFTQDIALSILGLSSSIFIQLLAQPYNLWCSYFGSEKSLIASQTSFLASTAMDISSAAFQRFKNDAVNNIMFITDSEMSAACHESLITIQGLFSSSLTKLGALAVYLSSINHSSMIESIVTLSKISSTTGIQLLKSLPGLLIKSNMLMINLSEKKRATPIDLELSNWSGIDRFLAITTGYIVLCALGTLYVKKRSPLLSGQVGRELETAIIDLLRQAGGVMKVILIISIEMLAFPLYCGLLLDISLLPLFENTTILSRIAFTLRSPLTSIFVHWFVGTCYMFHFALFVSMCRKIMRKGVLYFIRDPDDPTFHPVRDVLERNVTTQLQKILFSALVYGALILICLGGVVWGISLTLKGVLPVYWSSNEPVLEFPIDLLFYNFLIPFAVKFFRPSAKLHAMYSWWFRKCARKLRLTWFMFDERIIDEERHLVRRTWLDFFRSSNADPNFLIISGNPNSVFEQNPNLRAYYRRDGCYVRAPASDQVRIPKGSSIFLEVNEWNERIDQKPDRKDGIHGKESDLCKLVYIPPWFRVRIGIFIISIWVFAAITGVGVTILPLIVGRIVFSNILPPQVRKNDAYAFSIGIYILGSIIYCAFNFKTLLECTRKALVFDANTPRKLLNHMFSICTQVFRITWTYTAFLIVLPTLFAFLIEFYLIVPLHTYLAIEEKHVVNFVQSWTLGLLYVKLTARLILWYEDSRPAQSLRAITRNGYLNPDARLATRSFILPGALLLSTALLYPWAIARLTIVTVLQRSPEKHTLAYRYSYPICLCLCFLALVLWIVTGWIRNWKIKIRNEVYLIGEQLHNYGDRKEDNVCKRNDSIIAL
ncbi:hypothetical protein EPUL_005060 [Erysiphe pulchra]|uniref:RING-type E3 ubiquitin transferase n=1 Tax=Erysiphe pulchra TaxID=225359 RepID=A0A2S4PP60_9PEZI|nr:hypothetical protein EPUL_005060 [Erysiphe pulchra]